MSGKAVITINGRRYDASGSSLRPLDELKVASRSIDGVVASNKIRPSAVNATASTEARNHHTPERAVHHLKRQPAHAQTIARQVVKKPLVSSAVQHSDAVIIGHDRDTQLAKRAKQIPISPMLQRFSYPIMPVVAAPDEKSDTAADLPSSHAKDIFVERQLMLAKAHTEHVAKKKSLKHRIEHMTKTRKVLSAMAALVALAGAGGYLVYQNISMMSLRVAGTHAGFSADLPGYVPSGYGLSHNVVSDPGKIILTYKANSDDRRFLLEQSPTTWTTEALQQSIESATSGKYQTLEMNGMTIFISGENTASWVDHGRLFSVRGGADLSSDQIATIASSL